MKGLKTGGRSKGTPNKATAQMRDLVGLFVERNFSQVQACFDQLDPRDKILVIERMMRYVMPTYQAIHVTQDEPPKQVVDLTGIELETLQKLLSI